MKRVVLIVAYGVGGLLVATGLTFGALALAGNDIGEPARPIKSIGSQELAPPERSPTKESPKPTRTPKPTEKPSSGGGGDTAVGPVASPTEDHSGSTPTGSGAEASPTPGGSSGSGDSEDSHDSGDSGGGDDHPGGDD